MVLRTVPHWKLTHLDEFPWESLALLQGSFGPFGPKVANRVRKWVPGPFRPGAQKVQNGVEKESKSTLFQLF